MNYLHLISLTYNFLEAMLNFDFPFVDMVFKQNHILLKNQIASCNQKGNRVLEVSVCFRFSTGFALRMGQHSTLFDNFSFLRFTFPRLLLDSRL